MLSLFAHNNGLFWYRCTVSSYGFLSFLESFRPHSLVVGASGGDNLHGDHPSECCGLRRGSMDICTYTLSS